MRYSASHKEETRQRLLDSSGAIAKRDGFSSVGVDALMKAVGLTGGAFYNHFSSKGELFAAIVQRELTQSAERLGKASETFSRERLQRCLQRYLSQAHVDNVEGGCAIPALGAEIARADVAVRESTEEALLALQRVWAQLLDSDQEAWALLSQCVGALLLARMSASEETRQAIVDSSLAFLLRHLDEAAPAS
ncbi:TetR/AcrR family transcriptional regulator [Pseudomonas panipatensis]|jgi:AcrR family transcriptional regulator|uniref:Transcriptional regulator, TetR family n=1 Tax=Pseudomonas panipatensis TaxID=428992 RepID=A0A1G8JW56_9PSED|nr:TetR/AcrR family transcriptional regulator [Pseudomonas panipatensis]SDI35454.1 transcriptional regulator, TetR family [Pseudomonas panipatensis]SMP62041.1 transcriptional regulator, TetR family [Pseudomonas panipatensis]